MKKTCFSLAFFLIFSLCISLPAFSESDEKSDKPETVPELSEPKINGKKKPIFHDGYLDVNYTLENYMNLRKGLFRIEFFGKTGTFNIYCTNQNGKEVPLLASANVCLSTGFFLKVDEKIRRLNSESRVIKELRLLEDESGAQLVYTLENHVRFVIDFSFVSSQKDSPADIIRFRTYTVNLGLDDHVVDIKGIFDTIPGESSSVHFVTTRGKKIRNEIRFQGDEIRLERSTVCSNGSTSFQFVFEGAGIHNIDSVVFANVDEIYKMEWDAAIRKGRGFTNIRAYEDSAIMIDWPSFLLPPDQKVENTFYIAAATNDEYPAGVAYIDRLESLVKTDENQEKKEDKTPEKKENPEKRTDIDFIIPPIKDYQLDPEYIQALIDKIDALQSSKDVNKKEIRKLNAELDAILAKLRQR